MPKKYVISNLLMAFIPLLCTSAISSFIIVRAMNRPVMDYDVHILLLVTIFLSLIGILGTIFLIEIDELEER